MVRDSVHEIVHKKQKVSNAIPKKRTKFSRRIRKRFLCQKSSRQLTPIAGTQSFQLYRQFPVNGSVDH